MIDLEKREKEILAGLKDFQRDTVERINDLFKNGQTRVLVADEVGLGKTLIAKGVIAKTAVMHKNAGDDLFKVVYICSNQNIARQNIIKLKIHKEVTVDNTGDTRLSMQHLKFYEQKNDKKIIDNYVQLIPLTPATSFNIIGGVGLVQERALIFSILKRLPMFSSYKKELEIILKNDARSWDSWAEERMEDRVVDCDKNSGKVYLREVLSRVETALKGEFKDLEEDILNSVKSMKKNKNCSENLYSLIYRMRQMMTQVSIDFLEPDLVIMDEFQRFRDLIKTDEDSEMSVLTKKFLKSGKVKTLLLSATPYKFYSTLEEISDSGSDEHYNEFMEVMDFVFEEDEIKRKNFRVAWRDFSDSLKQIDVDNFDNIYDKKLRAENLMFEGICRTERLMVSESGNAMLDTSKSEKSLEINEQDITSYIESDLITQELQKLGSKAISPIEYIKSCPYIFSFMDHYQLKRELKKYYGKSETLAKMAGKNSNCWLRKDVISRYEKLPETNARLTALLKETFANKAELLMWIPPSLPYYEMGGGYKNSESFSKTLVFSAWEMVPRMIASLVSYEAERKTTGKVLDKLTGREEGKSYFADNKRRYPRGRLNLSMKKNDKTGKPEPGRMSLFSLMYPSITLAKLFNTIDVLNNSEEVKSRNKIDKAIEEKLTPIFNEMISKYQWTKRGIPDERWYWAAPLILDKIKYGAIYGQWFGEYNLKKLDNDNQADGYEQTEEKEDKNLFSAHFNLLKESFASPIELNLGNVPKDLMENLILQTLGSPAVCALRMCSQDTTGDCQAMDAALKISREFIKKFNLPESTAMVEIIYGSDFSRKKIKEPDEAHWINVLKYCADGNLQAMLDEYKHMLVESYSLKDMPADSRILELAKLITTSMKTHTASYKVDTFRSFAPDNKRGEMRLRSHFAAGFYNSSGEGKVVQRTEALRQSFNSPFRPFVLATTSIGQEGLDFHVYCRKIMHWNLPSNPIDLEQREGRINRFKGLAIRQNVATKYRNISFKKDIWQEMFEECRKVEKGKHCELVPYWYLEPSDNEEGVRIERIVPMYLLSRDIAQYERLIKILSLYRVTLGQARQEELLTYILNNVEKDKIEEINKLFINLSPYYKNREKKNRRFSEEYVALGSNK